ncbi:TetR family transcriptional regulator [Streptomyces koyangensis]|uniref:TetR/AcrR family transcriptional regulator n=1 Tax=Streptomyces koyangensis TaxID=188770 RepID=UPI003452F4EA
MSAGRAADPTRQAAATGTQTALLERRKTALQLEIARAAVTLFTAQGVARTTGEQIAQAVGISSRTLWRHFPSKEGCVRPLLTSGLDSAVDALGDWPADVSLVDYLDSLQQRQVLPAPEPAVLQLLQLACSDPALRPVWLQAHDDALDILAGLLAHRSGQVRDALPVQVHAAILNSALRIGAEDFVLRSAQDPHALPRHLLAALRIASDSLPY